MEVTYLAVVSMISPYIGGLYPQYIVADGATTIDIEFSNLFIIL